MKFKQGKRMTFFYILISIVAFLQLQPYFIWNNLYIRYIYTAIFLISISFLLIFKSLKLERNNLILSIFASIIILYLNYSGFKIAILNLIFNIPLLVFILLSKKDKKMVFEYFSCIFAISLIPGIIIYVFHFLNINLSWSYLVPLNSLKTEEGIYYQRYFGSVILINPYVAQTKLYRLCAMFDEPGVVGTICALILAGHGYHLNKNKANIILLIGGILSFSLFFYLITLFYFIIDSIFEKKYKNLIIGLVFLVILGIFSSGVIKNDFIQENIIDRIEIKDGKLQGDNRTTEYFDTAFNEFLENGTSTLLFGMGSGASSTNKLIEASASWKKLVYDSGFVGLGMIICFLLITVIMYNKTKSGIFFFLVVIACMYQRPGIFDLPNLTVILGGLIYQANSFEIESKIDKAVSN